MAIVNRDKDISEQKDVLQAAIPAVVTGASVMVCAIPSPGILAAIDVAAFGLSGAPGWQFNILRFVAGSGSTAIAVGVSILTVVGFGTSGMQQVAGVSSLGVAPVLAPQGSSLALLQAGDLIQVVSSGANTAVASANVSVVVKKTQDVLSQFGISG